MNIASGIKQKPYKYHDGTEIVIPEECYNKTGVIKKNVFKAIVLRDTEAMLKFGIIIRHAA